MLNVLYLPLNDADSVQQGMYDAWRNVGVNLEIFDFYRMWLSHKNAPLINQQLIQKIQSYQPHLVHMQLQFTGVIELETLMRAKQVSPNTIFTNWSGDIRDSAINDFVKLTNGLDHSLISSTGQLDMYRRSGCRNVKYWQIGFDPNFSRPLNYDQFTYDVSFVGNNYGNVFPDGPLRTDAVRRCVHSFGGRAGIFGSGWDVPSRGVSPKDTNEIYNRSICALSVSNFNSVGHYFSDRLLACLGSGRPTISWYFPGCESYFVDGSEIFYAHNTTDIVNIVNFCKNNPQIANQVGINGYKKTLKEHTFTSRVIELLHITGLIDMV